MKLDLESLQQQIPYYLTAEDRQVLVDELKAISKGGTANYFLSPYKDAFRADMLQGDGWRAFQLFKFDTGERRWVQGIILSNSCDVEPGNARDTPARVISLRWSSWPTLKSCFAVAKLSHKRWTRNSRKSGRRRLQTCSFYRPVAHWPKTILSAWTTHTRCLLQPISVRRRGRSSSR